MKNILSSLKQFLCDHELDCDNQIRITVCRKCGKKYWIKEFKSLFS